MEEQQNETPQSETTPQVGQTQAIKEKIAAAKTDIVAKSGAGGGESFVNRVLHLILEILPDIIDLFHGSKSSGGASVAASVGNSAPGSAEVQNAPGGDPADPVYSPEVNAGPAK